MQYIGKYFGRQLYWLDPDNFFSQFPEKDWVWLLIANQEPDLEKFEKLLRVAISKDILEFKAHGIFGEKLHDLFDEIIVLMETMENHPEIEVMTTWHNEQTLKDTLWQCFFATCLPNRANLDNIKIICTDLDAVNRIEEIKSYIKTFELG